MASMFYWYRLVSCFSAVVFFFGSAVMLLFHFGVHMNYDLREQTRTWLHISKHGNILHLWQLLHIMGILHLQTYHMASWIFFQEWYWNAACKLEKWSYAAAINTVLEATQGQCNLNGPTFMWSNWFSCLLISRQTLKFHFNQCLHCWIDHVNLASTLDEFNNITFMWSADCIPPYT